MLKNTVFKTVDMLLLKITGLYRCVHLVLGLLETLVKGLFALTLNGERRLTREQQCGYPELMLLACRYLQYLLYVIVQALFTSTIPYNRFILYNKDYMLGEKMYSDRLLEKIILICH